MSSHSDELDDLRRLSGITKGITTAAAGSNISITAAEKARIMREKNIKPGTPAWFQLWFSLPYLTGEQPVNK